MAYPIILFTYNRPEHTRKVVEALALNKLASETKLYICSDAAKSDKELEKVLECRAYFKTITGFQSVEIIELEENHNVKRAVRRMGDMMSARYDAWIALEDDALPHAYFLQFMNDALLYYRDNKRVALINAYAHEKAFKNALIKNNYPYDVVFGPAFHCFGWGTWANKWKNFDIAMPSKDYFKGMGNKFTILFKTTWGHLLSHKVASKPTSELWDIHMTYYMLKNNLVAVWPVRGYISNIGFDGSGLHGYNFDPAIFSELLDPKEKLVFTDDIDKSRAYDFQIFIGVAKKWVPAFTGNFLKKLVSSKK